MKRNYRRIGSAIGLVLACGAAQADLKDPLPDSLTVAGITLYGTVDVGYAYQSHGVPLSSQYVGGLEYQAFTTTRNFAGSQSTLAESGLEQSKVGIKVERPIADDWTLLARAETGFNPLSGQLTDACGSIASNGGQAQGTQNANADSSRCGQAFNSLLWGGVSNPTYGTLSLGRHNSLQLDALFQYDPQALSYAFSFLGYSGFNGGAGSTQAARWDNAIKYAYANGPFHLAGMYSNGGRDTGILHHAFAAQGGVVFKGLSVDFVYENVQGAVNLRSSFDDPANPIPSPGLSAFISNNTSYNLLGKYSFDLASQDKLTVYAGYSHIRKEFGSTEPGAEAQGSYQITVPIYIIDPAVYNMEWVGAKYAMRSGWNFSGAFYHINQNSWTVGKGTGPTPGATPVGCSAAGLLCSGSFYEASAVADYVINKHYDAYLGVNWSEVLDGLASGFPGNTVGTTGSETQTTAMVGFRVKF